MTAHPAHASALPENITTYLHRAGLSAKSAKTFPLTGDASDRRYFRVLEDDGRSIVLALHADSFDYATLPFVNVADLLGRMPVPIPAILDHADDLGVIALEDLGDVTLQAHLGAASATEHAALYRQAVGFIEVLQRRGAELRSAEYVPYTIAFDVAKLTWELQFFVRHFLEAYRGVQIAASRREALSKEWKQLAEELASEPRVLCHRDYHSRNLMLHHGRLYIIDFQDARMGPDTYDLVSLLRDAYTDFTEQSVEELIAYFIALKHPPMGSDDGAYAADFRRRFDTMAVQRTLKALGTFGYQTTARQNPVYIQYVPRTLMHVRNHLGGQPRFGRLREILGGMLEELR